MKQNEDFFDYCEKRKKNVDGYNDIAKKIKSFNKKERQYYRISCLVKLNKSIKDECISKNVLTSIAILITLLALSFSVSSTVNAIVDVRMNKYIDNLESENQEARNIIDNIKSSKQEDRILQVFAYNQSSGKLEFGATKSEIDFYLNFDDWGTLFKDEIVASAILDRLLHHSRIISISGNSYRLKDHISTKENCA